MKTTKTQTALEQRITSLIDKVGAKHGVLYDRAEMEETVEIADDYYKYMPQEYQNALTPDIVVLAHVEYEITGKDVDNLVEEAYQKLKDLPF